MNKQYFEGFDFPNDAFLVSLNEIQSPVMKSKFSPSFVDDIASRGK